MSDDAKTILAVVLITPALILLALAIGNMTVWALNTLFALAIPYTVKTSSAAALLLILVRVRKPSADR